MREEVEEDEVDRGLDMDEEGRGVGGNGEEVTIWAASGMICRQKSPEKEPNHTTKRAADISYMQTSGG